MNMHTLAERYTIFQKAVGLWGVESQVNMMMEEMAELTKAFLKARRNWSDQFSTEVLEELADVSIMLEQMEFITRNITQASLDAQGKNLHNVVQEIRTRKLDRLAKMVGCEPKN